MSRADYRINNPCHFWVQGCAPQLLVGLQTSLSTDIYVYLPQAIVNLLIVTERACRADGRD